MTPSNTGSRNGIITWAVIATILGLGSLIWAIISFTQANKYQKDSADLVARYRAVGNINGDAYQALSAARDRRGESGTPLLDLAVKQTRDLTTLIGGSGTTDDARAAEEARAAVAAAQETAKNGASIDGSSLTAAIRGLTGYVKTLQTNTQTLQQQAAAAEARAKAAEEANAQVVTASNQKVDQIQQLATSSQQDADAYRQSRNTQYDQLVNERNQLQQQAEQSIGESRNRIADLQQQLAALNRENSELKNQLGAFRVPTNQIVQQADGQITRTAGADTVYINLGQGNQIAPGMTFEVYDKAGVPNVTSQEPSQDSRLQGKASIEVIRVQPGTSECRVVRLSPGQAITEGDPIVNVVYDKNVKFNFVVYGKFNLDNRGPATEDDANVIRRLISRWGAQVTDKLDSKTDFLVLGEEPQVPAYSQDELAREPEKAFQKEQAERALEQYQDLRNRANQLNIPILNQNRFLYMIGYYEEAAR